MSKSTSGKRGAQPGNKNALGHGGLPGNQNAFKHGFYSHSFTREEKKRLARKVEGELLDEEGLLKSFIDRTYVAVSSEPMDLEKYVASLRAVSLAVGRIESIHRSRKALYDQLTSLDKAMEELKYIPWEED